jgi:tRNA A-37 threonylcarbamoyl transferase component Bud32
MTAIRGSVNNAKGYGIQSSSKAATVDHLSTIDQIKDWNGIDTVCTLLALVAKSEQEQEVVEESQRQMKRETKAYEILHDLQGTRIPRFIRQGMLLDGIIEVLAVEYMGETIVPESVTPEQIHQAQDILDIIHKIGVAHGNIATESLLVHPTTGKVVFIDFGYAIFKNETHNDEKWNMLIAKDRNNLESIFGLTKRAKRSLSTSDLLDDDEPSAKRVAI